MTINTIPENSFYAKVEGRWARCWIDQDGLHARYADRSHEVYEGAYPAAFQSGWGKEVTVENCKIEYDPSLEGAGKDGKFKFIVEHG